MTELVQRHMESMTEEIEEMRRTKLFTMEETRAILKKRKQYEYKINGVTKNLEDFKDYILYEKILLKDIKVRRNKYGIADRKSGIEFKILKRIKYLYEIALQRFASDFPLCLSYFKFCKESNYNQAASLVIQNMIKNFSQNPEVWQIAAAWHIKRDMNQALNIIHKGLTIHKNCQLLYSEAIHLELLNTGKDDLSKNSKGQQTNYSLCCKKIETYIQSVFDNIGDYKFLLDILKLLEPHTFTESVQNMVIKRLIEHHSSEELVWHSLAQREKNGFHYEVADRNMSTRFSLNRCFEKYQQGLAKVPESKRSALWTLYLDCLVDLQQQDQVANIVKKNTLLTALEDASNQIVLDEKYFIIWAKLMDNESEVLKVIEKGLTALPQSVELWKLRLKYAVMKDQISEVNQIFKQAILKLKEKAAPIWIMTIRYHTLTSSNEVIDLIYKDGVKQPKDVSDILKPEYIQWLSLCRGINEAREVYNSLAQQEPYCKELHAAMVKIESVEIDQDVGKLENVHKLACEQFGKEDVDVWIGYIEFYLRNHKTFEQQSVIFDLNNKINQISREAENTFRYYKEELLLADFKQKFESLKSSQDI